MNETLINLDCPYNLLTKSLTFNGFDVAHAHYLEKYPQYYDFMWSSLELGRTVIMDQGDLSIDRYKYWIDKLEPTYYILPYHENALKHISTITSFGHTDHNCNKIGIVRGNNSVEVIDCYQYLDVFLDRDDMIGFDESKGMSNECRVDNVMRLDMTWIINRFRKHHVIGGMLPNEYLFFKDMKYVHTISTDTPIMVSLAGEEIRPWGTKEVPDIKTHDIFDVNVEYDMDLLEFNIDTFMNLMDKPKIFS